MLTRPGGRFAKRREEKMTNEYHVVPSSAAESLRLEKPDANTSELTQQERHWEYCWQMLPKVSRSFVLPISMLSGELRRSVTCGYLLCRIVDTIEDDPELTLSQRRTLYERWLSMLDGDTSSLSFAGRASSDDPEMQLAANAPVVLSVLTELDNVFEDTVKRWVIEMTHGMRTYSERQHALSREHMLLNLNDLDRYCYYVAGTVGHMLTELFGETLRRRHESWTVQSTEELRLSAEAFGQGLQLVNIIKDVAADARHGRSFLPRTLLFGRDVEGKEPRSALELNHVEIKPLFKRARAGLRGAVDYTCRIPETDRDMRLFCLIPLSMAVKTLELCEESPGLFDPEQPVKISREEVHETLEECEENVGSNDEVRNMFACLCT
jgi:farnesyl-diphosphate farnesyltransferase